MSYYSLSRKRLKKNLSMFQRLTALGIAMILSAGMYAQHDSIIHRTHAIDEVTVTTHRLQRNLLGSKPIQLMNREELQLLGLNNLADAVKKFAGASVKDYGGIGGMKTVSVRNLGAHHTAVSYDGVTISNTQAGQIDIGRYQTDNIQELSLAMGEEDDQMQSARHYASAGVLSITTLRDARYKMRSAVRVGSFGLVSPSLRLSQPLGQRTALSLGGTFMRADGVYPFTLKNGRMRTREKRYNSDIESWQGEANLYHTWADSSQLDVKAYWYRSERGLPGAVILYNDKSDERLWDEDFFTQAVWRKRFSPQWNLHARVKYAHSWNRYEDTDVKYRDGKLTDVARQNEYYASATVGWTPIDNLTFALTEDIAFNNLRSNISISDNLNNPPYPKRFTSLTALSARYVWNRLTLNASLVGTYATEKVKAGKQPDDRRRLSPSASLSFRLLNDEALYVRLMYKSTFRMPSFNDLYYIRMGNTGLRPENANEYNVGVTWSGQPVRWLKFLSITVDGYFNDVTDKIVAFPSTYVWKMANFGKVYIHGIDATMATEVPFGRKMSLVLTGAYTWQQAEDHEKRSATYGLQLPYTPKHVGNGSLMLCTPWVNVGYSVLAQGERWSSAQTTQEYHLKAYAEHSLTLSHEFRLRSCRLNLQGTVHNLTDAQYEIIKYYPMPGRSWSVGTTIEF